MANFEQHINVAVIATGVLIVPLASSGLITIEESLISLSLGVLGGILPDLDSDRSKPVQISFKILSIFIPLLILISLSDMNLPILQMIAMWLFSSVVLGLTLFKLFLALTKHRGIFHSIPMGILFFQLTNIIFYHLLNYSLTFSTIAGFFVFFGFIIHLLLDELVSLNILGLKIKSSLGTALKLYTKHNLIGTAIVYTLIVGLYLFLPIEKEVFIKMIEILKTVKLV